MAKEAMKAFEIVLEQANGLNRELQMQVYNSLGIDSNDDRLREYIQSSIEYFDFNSKENQFLQQVQTVIDEELKKMQAQISSGQSVDYNSISNSLMERLKSLRGFEFSLEYDFITLSKQVSSKFQTGVSSDELCRHLLSKQDRIKGIISSYNQSLIDSLVKLTPQLLDELKEEAEKQQNISAVNESVVKQTSSNESSRTDGQVIDWLIEASKKRYNELQRRLSYLSSSAVASVSSSKIMYEKAGIKKALKQLGELIEKLSAGKEAQDLISKYSNVSDVSMLFDKIISETAPSVVSVNSLTSTVDDLYSREFSTSFSQYSMPEIKIEDVKSSVNNANSLSELLAIRKAILEVIGTQYYDTNKQLENELASLNDKIIALTMTKSKDLTPDDPAPTANAEVGNSQNDISSLIDSGDFYSVLQGIPLSQADKYRDFITSSLKSMMSKWDQKARAARTFEERRKSYQEFLEMYDNFRDYIPLEVAGMLRNNLSELEKYIQQHKPQEVEGVRYSSDSEASQNLSAKKMQ